MAYTDYPSGRMKIISFIEDPKAVDRIIRSLELAFEAERVRLGRAAYSSICPAEVPDGSRGEWGVFLRVSVAVFLTFQGRSISGT
jgi:hypothetical protein